MESLAVKRELLASLTEEYILMHYPYIKQQSDIADKEFWTAFIVEKLGIDVNEIANTVYNTAARILDGESTLEDEVNKLSVDDNGNQIFVEWSGRNVPISMAWEQLIKVGVRVGWVQKVKQAYRRLIVDEKFIADIIELSNYYPPYPFEG